MYPDVLREHIRRCRSATQQPFGVNVPLLYPDADKIIRVILEEKVKIVFTSAGNPGTWTPVLKSDGITVVHVIANKKFAVKAENCGVDAVVAEGFEAGGHNGREETTTLCLVPMIKSAISIPVLAAGGISDGKTMLAAFALGADGVQVGSRFAASVESSAHENFKQAIVQAAEGDTRLSMKALMPVRLLKNEFFKRIEEAETRGAGKDELMALLGKGRAKRGMFEGDLAEGELEIGQAAGNIRDIKPAAQIVKDIWEEFLSEKEKLCLEW